MHKRFYVDPGFHAQEHFPAQRELKKQSQCPEPYEEDNLLILRVVPRRASEDKEKVDGYFKSAMNRFRAGLFSSSRKLFVNRALGAKLCINDISSGAIAERSDQVHLYD